jgi:hypothetical protein
VRLKKLLLFDAPYEVALIELFLPITFYNVMKDEMWFEIEETIGSKVRKHRAVVSADRHTNDSLLNELDSMLFGHSLTAGRNLDTKKVFISSLKSGKCKLTLSAPLSNVLGWYEKVTGLDIQAGSIIECKDQAMDVSRGFQVMWVYCEQLVDEIIVGGVKAPLLDYVVPNFSSDTNHVEIPNNPTYLPVRPRLSPLSSLKVEIRDNLGRLVDFRQDHDQPQATLHFRRL